MTTTMTRRNELCKRDAFLRNRLLSFLRSQKHRGGGRRVEGGGGGGPPGGDTYMRIDHEKVAEVEDLEDADGKEDDNLEDGPPLHAAVGALRGCT